MDDNEYAPQSGDRNAAPQNGWQAPSGQPAAGENAWHAPSGQPAAGENGRQAPFGRYATGDGEFAPFESVRFVPIGDGRYAPVSGGPYPDGAFLAAGSPPSNGGLPPGHGWPMPGDQARQPVPSRRRGRSVLATVTALGLVLAIGGVARADQLHVISPFGQRISLASLTSHSSTVASSASGAIVDVVSTEKYLGETSAGTGLVLTGTGEILTNNHVVNGATSIKVTVVSTGRTYSATVVGTDPTQDVAVIQLSGASGLKTVPVTSSKVSVGEHVVASGNAGGVGGTPSTVTGSVTALRQSITATDDGGSNPEALTGLIETNAPIVAGDSGGPLTTTAGKVIGIDTAASASSSGQGGFIGQNTSNTTTGQSYAIPITTALTIAAQIESGRASSTVHLGVHGFLGVELADSASSGTGSAGSGSTGGAGGFGGYGGYGYGFGSGSGSYGYGYGSGDGSGSTGSTSTVSGATISGVVAGGTAAAAGIEAGDVITSVNGTKVTSTTSLSTAMAKTKAGQRVSLGWTDTSGQSHTATVTLAPAAAD